KTPLAADVDFPRLAEQYAVSGGDIKNAVIKAAAAAAAEPGPDLGKRIAQRHFEDAMDEVIAAHSVMQQSVFADVRKVVPDPVTSVQVVEAKWQAAVVVSLALAGAAFL